MLRFLKNLKKEVPETSNIEPIYVKDYFKQKSTDEIIAEIHETFYTEVDRLLADAKITKSTETTKQTLIDKAARLQKLGFGQSKDCIEANEEIARIGKLQAENEAKEHLARAIEYFSFKYPNYKFITEDSVKKICAKYNLIYGDISKYEGFVPEKNLKDIENVLVDPLDACYEKKEHYSGRWMREAKHLGFISGKEKLESETKASVHKQYNDSMPIYDAYRSWKSTLACNLEIAAPLKDFDTKNMEVKDFQLSKVHIPDPIVLKPVCFENQKHYLIVTAWGDEASDPLVVNQKMN